MGLYEYYDHYTKNQSLLSTEELVKSRFFRNQHLDIAKKSAWMAFVNRRSERIARPANFAGLRGELPFFSWLRIDTKAEFGLLHHSAKFFVVLAKALLYGKIF